MSRFAVAVLTAIPILKHPLRSRQDVYPINLIESRQDTYPTIYCNFADRLNFNVIPLLPPAYPSVPSKLTCSSPLIATTNSISCYSQPSQSGMDGEPKCYDSGDAIVMIAVIGLGMRGDLMQGQIHQT